MRALKMAVLVAALALCSGPSFPRPTAQSQHSPVSQPSSVSQSSSPPQTSPVPQASSSPPPSPASESSLPSGSQSSPPRYSADGLYNLANSYARAGKPGLAVLNYERAALLAPYDPDITANLEYVRTSAHVATAPRSRFARIATAASPALAAWLGVVGIILVGAALLAKRATPRLRWVRACGMLVGTALLSLTVSNAMLLWPRMHEAVVLINQTPALVSPVPMADTAFVLQEADTVAITAKHEDFVLIRTHSGLSGWVARANLGAVVP